MNERLNISTGTIWENKVGYSRAVRIGNIIEVAGTTAIDDDDGEIMFPHEPYNQTQYALLKIKQALYDVGSKLEDVIRTRIYVTDIDYWQAIGRAHAEIFSDIKPVSTMVEVSRLIDDRLVVEIEVTAIINENNG